MLNATSLTVPESRRADHELADDWCTVFGAGVLLVALPGWHSPRVLVPVETTASRWRGSAFYPAFRPAARLYRLLLRAKAMSGIGSARVPALPDAPLLRDFLGDVLPTARVQAVLVGRPGAGQKLTAELTDAEGTIVGYLKCASKPLARQRLANEYRVLRELPSGAGPTPLKLGQLGSLDALLLSPVRGASVRAALPPPARLSEFTAALATAEALPLGCHPWTRDLSLRAEPSVDRSLAALSGRSWSVVRQHGDLAPWNLFQTTPRSLAAVDWESGRADGFPGIDLAQYVLQVACLFHRWSPGTARAYAIRYLAGDLHLNLSMQEAGAIVDLAAHDAFQQALGSGHPSADPTQRWRRAVWERTE